MLFIESDAYGYDELLQHFKTVNILNRNNQVRIHQLIGIYANVVRYANLHIARYSKVQI